MTDKKKTKKLKPRVGRVDYDFSALSAKPKAAKKVEWNPWPRCHPKCEHCFDLERDFESAQETVTETEEEIESQLVDISTAKKEMSAILVKMRAHVKTKAHKDGVKSGEL